MPKKVKPAVIQKPEEPIDTTEIVEPKESTRFNNYQYFCDLFKTQKYKCI